MRLASIAIVTTLPLLAAKAPLAAATTTEPAGPTPPSAAAVDDVRTESVPLPDSLPDLGTGTTESHDDARPSTADGTGSHGLTSNVRGLAGASCALGAPPGGAGYAFQAVGPDGCPLRWDPCSPIDWWYNPSGANRPFDDIVWAIDSLSAMTGLTFRFRGPTSLIPSQWLSRPADQGTGLLIAFGGYFPAGVLGEAVTQSVGGPDVPSEIVRASVRLSIRNLMTRVQFRPVILHEIAHAVGLDHAADPASLMYPHYNGVDWFRPGDAAGLRLVGAAQGCVPDGVRAWIESVSPPTAMPPVDDRLWPPFVQTAANAILPFGNLEAVVVEGRAVRVRGWAFDANTKDPIGIAYGSVAFGRPRHVAVGLTGGHRPDVDLHVNQLGAHSGFDLAIELPPGHHTVCVAALDHDGAGSTGLHTSLGCHEVDIVK